MMRFEWRPFLERWSGEWADAYDPEEGGDPDSEALRDARWLGFQPAGEERIAALERRLGMRLPPSYRSFLEVSDGWRHAGSFVYLMGRSEEAHWYGDPHGMAEMERESLGPNASEEEIRATGMWSRALQLAIDSDMTEVLLDPEDVDERGEWALYEYASWYCSPPQRYASFRHFMEDQYRSFLGSAADGRPDFANDTTRRLDAEVEQARETALSGAYETAAAVLAEAAACGRPRAVRMLNQIDVLRGAGGRSEAGAALDDPYVAESVPLNCVEEVRSGRGPAGDEWLIGRYPDADRAAVARVLGEVRQGTFRYEAPGVFGEAVEAARELARWAEPEAAWRRLVSAVPSWMPESPDQIAPVGLLADSVLGPVITPARGRDLLATARGGGFPPGDPLPRAVVPDGLGWLADASEFQRGYRLVLVAGVEPGRLPEVLGSGGLLSAPLTAWDADRSGRSRSGETWEERVVARVGRAGPGWSFAFTGHCPDPDTPRFRTPATAGSRGTRALTVLAGPGHGSTGGPFLHFSLAEDGRPSGSFTLRDGRPTRSGVLPPELEPDRFTGPEGERAALEAIAAAFGVSLSREALLTGRLHSFETVSWLREPREGEGWAYWTYG